MGEVFQDEIEEMKRIKLIDEVLHGEIIEVEAKIYQDMNEKMSDIRLVKDLVLAYKQKEARRMFNNLLK